MKTLGLIGGTTWLSTIDYYRYLNQLTSERSGGSDSARLILYSVNFAELMKYVNADDWEGAGQFFSEIAVKLEKAGADAIILCANTIHLVADVVQQSVNIPVLHIVDAVAKEIEILNMKKVGLLGTRFTMEKDFFKTRLAGFGIEAIVPDGAGRDLIHESIYNEFDKEIFSDETKRKYLEIIDDLRAEGAEGVILGCTEIPILIKQSDHELPLFDTTYIHAKHAVDFALASAAPA